MTALPGAPIPVSESAAIPEEAVRTLAVCDTDGHLHDRGKTCVRAIATPVVAAELRRLADRWQQFADSSCRSLDIELYELVAQDLRARADAWEAAR